MSLVHENDSIDIQNKYKAYEENKGYSEDYVNKLMTNLLIENKLIIEPVLNSLSSTKIILFKAKQRDKDYKSATSDRFYDHLQNCSYNNIDTLVKNIEQITVLTLGTTTHHSIMKMENDLAPVIIKYSNF